LGSTIYYDDKLKLLRDIFGAETIELGDHQVTVDGKVYPILDDVIIALDPAQYPESIRQRLGMSVDDNPNEVSEFAKDIQKTFGAEWQKFRSVMSEHEEEFRQYFDVVDLETLGEKRVCDLGCGMGRWSHFFQDKVRELVLVDFSDAIFVARGNLKDATNAVFVMADVTRLPFRSDFADFAFSLGVLHHLPIDALQVVRTLSRFAPKLLIYLYSALDSRPGYHRILLRIVDGIRRVVSSIDSPAFRSVFTWVAMFGLYYPMIGLGALMRPFGLSGRVPLYDFYHGKSMERIRQDVYDRFFTAIEQRFSRAEIMTLEDTFARVLVSDQIPLWHFLCERSE
jgi:SAM-dependent methyltransferase